MTGLAHPRSKEFLGKAIAGFKLRGGYQCVILLSSFEEDMVRICANELMSMILQQKDDAPAALRAGAKLKAKIMNLGVDMMPSYLEYMYGGRPGEYDAPALRDPAFIVECLLNDLGAGFKDLRHFLVMLPDEALINCSDPMRACSLVLKMSGRESLLPYASRRARGEHLDDALGL